jgi:hypothetical protein
MPVRIASTIVIAEVSGDRPLGYLEEHTRVSPAVAAVLIDTFLDYGLKEAAAQEPVRAVL